MDGEAVPGPPGGEWTGGWKTVLAGALGVGVGASLYAMVVGLFIRPLHAEFGWTRSQIAFASILHLAVIPLTPFAGRLVDAIGVRVVSLVAFALWSLGYVALANLNGDIVQYYVISTLMSAVGVGTSVVVFTRPVAARFVRHRGAALGATISGVSITSMLALPLLQGLISNAGWRTAYLTLAALPWVLAAPAILAWLGPARSAGRESRGEPVAGVAITTAMTDRRFWLLALAMTLANIPIGGIVNQLQPMLTDHGFTAARAALLGSVFAGSVAVGRVGGGLLIDRLPPALVAPSCMLAHLVGASVILQPELPFQLAAVGAAAFGMAQGAEADFLAFFVARYFGVRSFATIFGALMMVVSVNLSLGGLVYAQSHDLLGSYRPALMAGMGLMAAAAMLVVTAELVTRGQASSAASKARRAGLVSSG